MSIDVQLINFESREFKKIASVLGPFRALFILRENLGIKEELFCPGMRTHKRKVGYGASYADNYRAFCDGITVAVFRKHEKYFFGNELVEARPLMVFGRTPAQTASNYLKALFRPKAAFLGGDKERALRYADGPFAFSIQFSHIKAPHFVL